MSKRSRVRNLRGTVPGVYETSFLFVHGIGEQNPGEMLDAFERPMRQLCAELAPDITINAESFPETDEEPAHTVWHVHGPRGVSEWLFAEARWADSFDPPTPIALRSWLREVRYWFVVFHFAASFIVRLFNLGTALEEAVSRRDFRRSAVLGLVLLGLPPRLLWALVWRLFVIPIVLFALRMSLRYHRVWVIKRIASVVTAFLGDSFALITDASAESAMLQRVSRDYVWCREQASHTIVIAHSQGASLARSVLKDRGTRQTTFVTLGAGVGVLHSLKGADLAREYRRAVPFLTVLVLIFSTILFNLFIVLPWVQRNDPAVSILRDYAACVLKGKDLSLCPTARLSDVGVSFGFVPIEVIFFMFVPLALDTYAKRYLRQLSLLRMWADRVAQLKLPAHCTRRWIDISSARDPVSLGGLLTDCCDESLSVSNSFWPILEHSTYSRNIAVLSKILALASKDVPTREAPGGEFLRLSLKNLEQQRRFALRLEVSATAVSLGLIVLLYFYIR